jgi:replicative DNA helicase
VWSLVRVFLSALTIRPVHHPQEPALRVMPMSTFDLPSDFSSEQPPTSVAATGRASNHQTPPAEPPIPPAAPLGGESAGSGGASGPRARSLGSLLDSVRDDLFSGRRPVEYAVANEPWGTLALRPGDVMGLAAPPGNGKTALVMQFVVDALRLHPAARCLVVNVEMTPEKLIERQISRLSGVPFADIAARSLLAARGRPIEDALVTLGAIGDRLFFMNEPYDLETIALAIQDVQPTILVVDYVQRIECCGGTLEARIRLNNVMREARIIASAGIAVVLVSAVGRTTSKRNGGYSSRELGLGSFRESSEIEYGLDDAYILADEESSGEDRGVGPRVMVLQHVKSRNHQRKDLRLEFDGAAQQFRLLPDRPRNRDGRGSDAEGFVAPADNVSASARSRRPTSLGIDPWSIDFPGNEPD